MPHQHLPPVFYRVRWCSIFSFLKKKIVHHWFFFKWLLYCLIYSSWLLLVSFNNIWKWYPSFNCYSVIISRKDFIKILSIITNSGKRNNYIYIICYFIFQNYYTPTRREGAILQSPCPSSVHTFVTDISASTGRNDFIFDIWFWHGDLYHVSPFQVYRTSTSCLQCDLEIFMFVVMKTFVTVISASIGRNDFIFDIWLWHGDLYRVSPFQVYRTSTSCLLCDLQMNESGYS